MTRPTIETATVELTDEATPHGSDIARGNRPPSIQEKFVSDLAAIIEHRGAGSVLYMVSRAFRTVQIERINRDGAHEEDSDDLALAGLVVNLETLARGIHNAGKYKKD